MQFSTKPETTQTTLNSGTYPNVRLMEAGTGISANEKLPILILNFELEDGTKVIHSEYTPVPFATETEGKFKERKVKWVETRYPDFITVLNGSLETDFDENSSDLNVFEKLFGEIADAINNAPGTGKELLAVRFETNNKGYLTLPSGMNRGRNKFIGKMEEYDQIKAVHEAKQMAQPVVFAVTETVSTETAPAPTPDSTLPF